MSHTLELEPIESKPTATSVRGKYAMSGIATVDELMAERRA